MKLLLLLLLPLKAATRTAGHVSNPTPARGTNLLLLLLLLMLLLLLVPWMLLMRMLLMRRLLLWLVLLVRDAVVALVDACRRVSPTGESVSGTIGRRYAAAHATAATYGRAHTTADTSLVWCTRRARRHALRQRLSGWYPGGVCRARHCLVESHAPCSSVAASQ